MKRIIFILLLLATVVSQGQILTGVRQSIQAKGYNYKEVALDSVFRPPLDTFKIRLSDSGAIAVKNGCLFLSQNGAWRLLVCAAAPLAIITQPLSQTVNAGANVTFTLVASGGTTPYTYQWFKNIVAISGATSSSYSISGVVTGDAGNYNCVVTDAASAFAISNTAVLTVNTPIAITYAYSSTDPYTDNSTAPTAGTTATTSISHNADLSITFPFAAENKFLWFKVPSGESTKVTWFVESLNNGSIPDVAFRAPFTVGGFTYYVTRDPAGFAFNSSLPVQLKQ